MLWFRAGQREAVMGSHSCHCLGVPGCPGTSWVLQCSWFWDPVGMGVLKATAVKEQVNPMHLKRLLHGLGFCSGALNLQLVCFS